MVGEKLAAGGRCAFFGVVAGRPHEGEPTGLIAEQRREFHARHRISSIDSFTSSEDELCALFTRAPEPGTTDAPARLARRH